MSVWMKHPNLDQLIQVPADAVTGHRRSGWVETDPPQPAPRAPKAAAPHNEPSTEPDVAAVDERPTETNTAPDGKES